MRMTTSGLDNEDAPSPRQRLLTGDENREARFRGLRALADLAHGTLSARASEMTQSQQFSMVANVEGLAELADGTFNTWHPQMSERSSLVSTVSMVQCPRSTQPSSMLSTSISDNSIMLQNAPREQRSSILASAASDSCLLSGDPATSSGVFAKQLSAQALRSTEEVHDLPERVSDRLGSLAEELQAGHRAQALCSEQREQLLTMSAECDLLRQELREAHATSAPCIDRACQCDRPLLLEKSSGPEAFRDQDDFKRHCYAESAVAYCEHEDAGQSDAASSPCRDAVEALELRLSESQKHVCALNAEMAEVRRVLAGLAPLDGGAAPLAERLSSNDAELLRLQQQLLSSPIGSVGYLLPSDGLEQDAQGPWMAIREQRSELEAERRRSAEREREVAKLRGQVSALRRAEREASRAAEEATRALLRVTASRMARAGPCVPQGPTAHKAADSGIPATERMFSFGKEP